MGEFNQKLEELHETLAAQEAAAAELAGAFSGIKNVFRADLTADEEALRKFLEIFSAARDPKAELPRNLYSREKEIFNSLLKHPPMKEKLAAGQFDAIRRFSECSQFDLADYIDARSDATKYLKSSTDKDIWAGFIAVGISLAAWILYSSNSETKKIPPDLVFLPMLLVTASGVLTGYLYNQLSRRRHNRDAHRLNIEMADALDALFDDHEICAELHRITAMKKYVAQNKEQYKGILDAIKGTREKIRIIESFVHNQETLEGRAAPAAALAKPTGGAYETPSAKQLISIVRLRQSMNDVVYAALGNLIACINPDSGELCGAGQPDSEEYQRAVSDFVFSWEYLTEHLGADKLQELLESEIIQSHVFVAMTEWDDPELGHKIIAMAPYLLQTAKAWQLVPDTPDALRGRLAGPAASASKPTVQPQALDLA